MTCSVTAMMLLLGLTCPLEIAETVVPKTVPSPGARQSPPVLVNPVLKPRDPFREIVPPEPKEQPKNLTPKPLATTPFTMTPADLEAAHNAVKRYGPITPYSLLPPKEFDHPYEGELTIERHETLADVAFHCNWPTALACAQRINETRCTIHLPQDFHIARHFGDALETLMRHEIAHCNGWRHQPPSPNAPAAAPPRYSDQGRAQTGLVAPPHASPK